MTCWWWRRDKGYSSVSIHAENLRAATSFFCARTGVFRKREFKFQMRWIVLRSWWSQTFLFGRGNSCWLFCDCPFLWMCWKCWTFRSNIHVLWHDVAKCKGCGAKTGSTRRCLKALRVNERRMRREHVAHTGSLSCMTDMIDTLYHCTICFACRRFCPCSGEAETTRTLKSVNPLTQSIVFRNFTSKPSNCLIKFGKKNTALSCQSVSLFPVSTKLPNAPRDLFSAARQGG